MDKLRLIAGSGRSGTTWVLDAIAEANELRPIFEPLHPDSSETALQYGYKYLTRGTKSSELQNLFMSAANNSLRSVWTSYRIRPVRLKPKGRHLRSATELKTLVRKWALFARRRWSYRQHQRRDAVVVKCIRANLMLDWIHANFDSRIVLLMRHPCAVVESQLRFPEHWDPYWLLAKYRSDRRLMQGPLRARSGVLDQKLSRPQALAAIWCIENLVPSSQAAANNYTVVFYEELLERPDVEWSRIATGLGVTIVPEDKLLERPSQQAAVRLQKLEINNEENYSKSYASWRARLTAADISQIASVLEGLGVTFYAVSENRPDVSSFCREFLSS